MTNVIPAQDGGHAALHGLSAAEILGLVAESFRTGQHAAGTAGNLLVPAALSQPDADQPELYFGSLPEWVRDWFCPVFRRNVDQRGEFRWSARWWESAEAVIRLEALWRAWEHLRLDPSLGMLEWFRDADAQLRVLLSPSGPFGGCSSHASAREPLPYEEPPPGYFPVYRAHTADEASIRDALAAPPS